MVCAKIQGQHVRLESRSHPWFSCISAFEKIPLRCTFCTSAVPHVLCQSRSITEVRLQLTSMFKVMDLTNRFALIRISHTAFSSSVLVYHPKCFELSDSFWNGQERKEITSWRLEKVSFNLDGLSDEDWGAWAGSGRRTGEWWGRWQLPQLVNHSYSWAFLEAQWAVRPMLDLEAVICSFLGTKRYWTTCVQRTNSDCLLRWLWVVAASSIWHIYGSVLAVCELWFAGCSWPLSCCSDFPVSVFTLCFLIVFLNSSRIQGFVVILQL